MSPVPAPVPGEPQEPRSDSGQGEAPPQPGRRGSGGERASERQPASLSWMLPDLRLPVDAWHVHYYRLRGFPVYWYTHSAIEYVCADPETIRAVELAAYDAAAR